MTTKTENNIKQFSQYVLGVCLAVIGFFLVTTLNEVKAQLKDHEQRLNQLERIQDKNTEVLRRIELKIDRIQKQLDK